MSFIFSYDSVPTSAIGWTGNPYSEVVQFEAEPKVLYFSREVSSNLYSDYVSVYNIEDRPSEYGEEFISDQKKFYLYLKPGLYNLFSESLPKILKMNQEHPGSLFICDETLVNFFEYEKVIMSIFIKMLEAANIEFRIINFEELNQIKINNFYLIDKERVEGTIANLSLVTDLVRSVQGEPTENPSRIVYLSRVNMEPRVGVVTVDEGLSYGSDNRLEDEEVLEQFFIENGIEVIRPHELISPDDQVESFKGVKVIISLTSSSIGNAFFIPKNGLIVELTTSFITEKDGWGYEDLHLMYSSLAYKLGHNYISLPNYSRKPLDIVNRIQDSKLIEYIQSFVSN